MGLRNAFEDLAVESTQQDILTRLGDLLTELTGKLQAGQAIQVSNFPAFPTTQAVSGPLTDAQLRALAVAVSGTVALDGPTLAALEAIQAAVSGTVNVGNFPATQPVSGTVALDAATLSALEIITAVVSGTVALDTATLTALENINASVSGTVALDAATLTALENINAAISGAVSVTNFPTSTEISNDVGNPVPVAGTVAVSNFPASQAIEVADPLPVTPPDDPTVIGTMDALNEVVEIDLPAGTSSVSVTLSGAFVGTVAFEGSIDGVFWYAQQLRSPSTTLNSLATTTSTVPTRWRGNIAGMAKFRVRMSAFTSGSVTAHIHIGTGTGGTFLLTPIPIGGVSAGNTVETTVLAAATWTGAWESVIHVASINLSVLSNQDGVLTVAYSRDGVTVDQTQNFPVLGATPRNPIIAPRGEYVRVSFTNNGVSTATLSIETVYRAAAAQVPLVEVRESVASNGLAGVSKAIVEGANSWIALSRNITNTPQRVDFGNLGRRSVMLRARSFAQTSDAIYIGSSNAVSSTNGVELRERESITLDLSTGAQVWAVGSRAAGNPLETVEIWDA
jgi:hypothetical protein